MPGIKAINSGIQLYKITARRQIPELELQRAPDNTLLRLPNTHGGDGEFHLFQDMYLM